MRCATKGSTFARDADGRIVSRTVDGATTSFTYDAAGQLTGATGPDRHTTQIGRASCRERV